MSRLLLALLMILKVASAAWAGPLPVKFARTEPAKLGYLLPIAAPQAQCLAVADQCGWLAVGHKARQPAQLTLMRLDEQGQPGDAFSIQTPCPDSLKARSYQVLSVAFHPRLPLLYVWQDVGPIQGKKPSPVDPAWAGFCHLLIYGLDRAAPKLLLSLARGPGFYCGTSGGTVVPDLANGRLLVPNVRLPVKTPRGEKASAGIGWYHVDGDGLPTASLTPRDHALPPMDAAEAVAAWPGRAAALRAALAEDQAIGAFESSPVNNRCFPGPTSGAGICPISRDVLLIGGPLGPVTWDRTSRRAAMSLVNLPNRFIAYYGARLTSHPALPVLYVATTRAGALYCLEHVDGSMTLAPQLIDMKSTAARTAPIVLPKRGLVAVGGPGGVYLVHVNAEGKFTADEGIHTPMPGKFIDALGYSERFDRLYVAVDK